MGYRVKDVKPPDPEERLPRYEVRNGATLDIAFECYYWKPTKGHNPHKHDHEGWPSPNHPGDACQMEPPRDIIPYLPRPIMRTPDDLVPIKLYEEGYAVGAILAFDDDIDDDDIYRFAVVGAPETPRENQVVVHIETYFEEVTEPREYKFTLFIVSETDVAIDAVCRGILVVLPGHRAGTRSEIFPTAPMTADEDEPVVMSG